MPRHTALPWQWLMATLICTSIPVLSVPCSWVQIVNSWSTVFKAVVNIQMEMSVDHWSLGIEFTHDVLKFEAWKGRVTKLSDKKFTVNNNCYNKKVYSCQCFQLPFLVRHQPGWVGNTTVSFNGQLTSSCPSDPCIEDAVTGISPLEAIIAVRKTVQNISDGLHNLEKISDRVNVLTNTRYKRETDNFSNDENNLLARLTNLTTYLQDKCVNKTRDCASINIEMFRNDLNSTFKNISDTEKISPGFLQAFETLKKKFDDIATKAEEAQGGTTETITPTTTTTVITGTTTTSTTKIPPVCPPKDNFLKRKRRSVLLNEYIQQRMVQVCLTPPSKTNSQWWCTGNAKSCYLKCDPGYVSLFTSTSCIDGAWTDLDKMECEPSVFLLIGGGYTLNVNVEIYHPSITCEKHLPQLEYKYWQSSATFVHNGVIYVCGGSHGTKDLCASLNMTDQSGEWKTYNISSVGREGHSAVVMRNNLYFIGGYLKDDNVWTTLPLDNEPTFTAVPNLSYRSNAQCVVKITENSFIVIGGYNSKNVTKYNVTSQTSTTLPLLRDKRWGHGCAMVEEGGKQWIVVVGGRHGYGFQNTTERLDFNGGTQWESLGQLNIARGYFRMGNTENGTIIMGGYNNDDGQLDTVEMLNWTTKQWKFVEPTLKTIRFRFDKVDVPASMFKCNIPDGAVCSTPPAKNNSQWWCSNNKSTCYLKCDPGYASLFSSTSCFGGAWTELDKMECEPSVILLIGGEDNAMDPSLEIYHPTIENVTCPNHPPTLDKNWSSHASFVHNGVVYVCGGLDTANICVSLNVTDPYGEWKTHNMASSRYDHSVVVMQNTVYFIETDTISIKLPLENLTSFSLVPNLPGHHEGSCIVKITEDSFVVTGGRDSFVLTGLGGSSYTENIKYNVTDQTYTLLPSLSKSRNFHGCVMVEEDGEQWIVLAGGQQDFVGVLATTERLNINGGTHWEPLGWLNVPRDGSRLVDTENGIIIMGGYDQNKLDTVEILDWTTKQWKLVKPSLKTKRYLFDKVEVPASIFSCDISNEINETVCSTPPTKTNGQPWWCTGNAKSCYLKCDPGYASLFTSTFCIDGAWTDLDKMECEPSVFLLIGGRTDAVNASVEIYHPNIENITCDNHPPQLDKHWLGSATFVHNGVIYVCGGEYTQDLCASLNMTDQSSEWKTHNISSDSRMDHSAVVMQDNLYFIGGNPNDDNVWTTLPLDNEPTFTPVQNLPYRNELPCVVKITEDSFIAIGGLNSQSVTKYNVTSQTSTTLPLMRETRWYHGCAMVEEGGKLWIVVAGGINTFGQHNTTERLDLNGGTQWESLGQLNIARYVFKMCDTENGTIVMGGYNWEEVGDLDTVEMLNWTTKQWKFVEPTLKTGRYLFDKVDVPASMFKCNIPNETGLTIISNITTIAASNDMSASTSQTDVLSCPFIIFEAGESLCQLWELLEDINNFISNQGRRIRQKRSLSTIENNLIRAMINITSETLNCCTNNATCEEGTLKQNYQIMNESYFQIKSSVAVSSNLKNQWDAEYSKYNSVPTQCKSVSCGGHLETKCSKCPQGNGANWCHGDCDWINETCVPGAKQCTPDAHVHNKCKCGEEICPIEGRCMSGGFCDKPTVCPEREVNGSSRRRRDTLPEDKVEFRLVHINETGTMATVRDVEENLDKAKKLLLSCDIAKLDDGHIEGAHYGGNVSNEDCTGCLYKIIKNNGTMFCTPDKHVYKRCQCGLEICDVGNSCTEGSCNRKTVCDERELNRKRRKRDAPEVCDERELNRKRRKRDAPEGEIMFKMIHVNETGNMATVEEVNTTANLVKVKKLLKKCDIVNLEDGIIEGDGYSGKVTNETCLSCQFKIIKSKGLNFCSPKNHVVESCTCGEYICQQGESCSGGKCIQKLAACPPGYKLQSNDTNIERKRQESPGKEKFRFVPIHSTGAMVSVEEVEMEKNLEEIQKLLDRCDKAKLDGGFIDGSGSITEESCNDCKYKIVRIEDPPDPKVYNRNVGGHCCFIIYSNNNTYILTNHSLLRSFPEKCSSANSSCSYTLRQDLDYKDANPYCLNEIKNYTCCSKDTGALCDNYGKETMSNVNSTGICSNICKKIADCSSNITNDWCINNNLVTDNTEDILEEDRTTSVIASSAPGTEDKFTATTATTAVEDNSTSPFWIPDRCEIIVPPPAEQTAEVYPSNLPSQPFQCERNVPCRTARSGKSCGFWAFWSYTCQQGYNYDTFFTSKNWYEIRYARYFKAYYLKHGCCYQILPQCSTELTKFKKCPSASSARGGKFSAAVHACVWGFTDKRFSNLSLEECKKECDKALCNSLEYKEDTMQCFLSQESKETQPNDYQEPCSGSYSNLIYLEHTG